MRKKILTFFIAFALGITALPVNAFATESVAEVQDTVVVGNYTGSYTKEKMLPFTAVLQSWKKMSAIWKKRVEKFTYSEHIRRKNRTVTIPSF